MREEELEDAELEEEDAAGRQAALDKAAALAVDLYEKEDEAGKKQQSVCVIFFQPSKLHHF